MVVDILKLFSILLTIILAIIFVGFGLSYCIDMFYIWLGFKDTFFPVLVTYYAIIAFIGSVIFVVCKRKEVKG